MKKHVILSLFLSLVLGFAHVSAVAETKKEPPREPDSEYVEKSDSAGQGESGGLFDFLPFVGRKRTKVESEVLTPSPLPTESKPVLQKKELDELRNAAEKWVLTSEYAEPTVRQDENGRFYRDYIVFADEYEAKVLRGRSEDKPFIGHVYIRGDYFKTQPHDTPEAAAADFKFKFTSREFRIIFDRIKKWEYSSDPGSDPYVFVERWEFNGLQSRPIVKLPENPVPAPQPEAKEEAATPPPRPADE